MENVSEAVSRKWRILSCLVVSMFLCFGVWWLFQIPSVGKGGVFLAVGATLMPLFWEKVGIIGKMSWIAMLFVLLAVEYRAIDKDQRDAAAQEKTDLQAMGYGFKTILENQQTSFAHLISQSQVNFDSLIQDERNNFNKMLMKNIEMQGQEHTNFSVLLNQEKELLAKQEELYDFTSNKLLPASDPTPPNSCGKTSSDDVSIILGTHRNVAVTNKFPHVILNMRNRDVISIDRGSAGSLVLTVDTRDTSGKIIASLSKDGFVVSKNYELYLLRPDKSTVIIEDGYGKAVLKARFMNPTTFALEGLVQSGGQAIPLDFPSFLQDDCFFHSGTEDIRLN